jgi:hypothetical protein
MMLKQVGLGVQCWSGLNCWFHLLFCLFLFQLKASEQLHLLIVNIVCHLQVVIWQDAIEALFSLFHEALFCITLLKTLDPELEKVEQLFVSKFLLKFLICLIVPTRPWFAAIQLLHHHF